MPNLYENFSKRGEICLFDTKLTICAVVTLKASNIHMFETRLTFKMFLIRVFYVLQCRISLENHP